MERAIWLDSEEALDGRGEIEDDLRESIFSTDDRLVPSLLFELESFECAIGRIPVSMLMQQ